MALLDPAQAPSIGATVALRPHQPQVQAAVAGFAPAPTPCLSAEEVQLARMVNEYRTSLGLPAVTLSSSLSQVARLHATDASANYRLSKTCNMHSWSDQGSWRGCCYSPNHSDMDCMQLKPKELTSYPGRGYEISYMRWWDDGSPAPVNAQDALAGWKRSPGHHQVMVNQGIWKQVNWQAMGVGVANGYACLWFGQEKDPAGVPGNCE